jgi:hypothetical protein
MDIIASPITTGRKRRLFCGAMALIVLAGGLAGCANDYDHAYLFYSDAPGNGHSKAYLYPTDYTRDYRSYPGDAMVANH